MANPALHKAMQRLRASVQANDGATMADGELLEHFIAQRDEAAFALLVRRHGPMVYGVCRRILRNDADADDAFQATFLVLVRKAASVRPRGMVSNWLYGVAHNTALKAKAMIQQRRIKETEAGKMPKGKADEAWQQVESVVDTELSRLPDKYRVPIVLCDLEGKTIKEATHDLGWPQGTVASRLTRGRVLLARRLSKHGLTMTAGLLAGALGHSASASVPASLTAATVHAGALLAAGKAAAAAGGASATALALTDGMLKTMLLVKLKMAAAVAAVVAVITAGIGGYSYHAWNQSSDSQPRSGSGTACQQPPPATVTQPEPTTATSAWNTGCSVPATPTDEPPKDVKTQTKVVIVGRPETRPIFTPPCVPGQPGRPGVQAYSIRLSADGRILERVWVAAPGAEGKVAEPRVLIHGASPTWTASAKFSPADVKVVILTFVKDKQVLLRVCDQIRAKAGGSPELPPYWIPPGSLMVGNVVELHGSGSRMYRIEAQKGES